MVDENPLTAPLIVKDLQGGIVGQTGTVWTIAPDGGFTVARQIGARVAPAHKRGRLNAEQKERLQFLLRRPAMTALPAQLGEAPHANARQVTVSCGAISTAVTLPAASGLETLRAQGSDHHSAQVLDLLELLGDMIGR